MEQNVKIKKRFCAQKDSTFNYSSTKNCRHRRNQFKLFIKTQSNKIKVYLLMQKKVNFY